MRGLYKKLLLIWMLCLPIFVTGQVLTGEIISLAQPGCAPPHEGSIIVGGVNGSPPYTYTLNGAVVQSSGSFGGLPLGDHTIVISDFLGDIFTINFSIDIANQLQIDVFDIKNVTCFGQNDGYITVIATSGTSPFQFSIDGGSSFQSSGTFNDLINGDYEIIGMDAAGCLDTVLAVVSALSEINLVAINLENIQCYGDSSGSVQVLGELGTAPYLYSIDSVTFQSDENFTNISEGNYTFWVEDANGCLGNLDLEFTEPSELILQNINNTATTCFNGDDGSISFESQGGIAPYHFQLNGMNDGVDLFYNDLNPGIYTLSAFDANNCQVDSVLSIGQADSIEISVENIVLPLCYGESNGSMEVSAIGGQGPFEYKIEGQTIWETSGIFTDLISATYTVKVRDVNFCENEIEFTLNEQSELNLSILNQVNVFCNISTDGSVEMDASGGILDYSFSLDGGAFQSSPIFNNLSSGSYEVSLMDGNGCLDTMMVSIEETNDLSIDDVLIQAAICGTSNTGEITVLASGGISPYMYNIDGSVFQVSNIFAAVDSGNHVINVLASDGCEITTSVFSPSVSPLEFIVINHIDPICVGSSSGSIEVGVSNGNAPFQYSFDGGMSWQASNVFNGLVDSIYSFVIQDQDACLVDSLISFEEQSDLTIDLISISSDLCPEALDGEVSIAGLDGLLPYSYSDDGINFSGVSTFNGLSPGDQQLWVQDANNCIIDSTFSISSLDTPTVVIDTLQDPSCNSYSDGVINITANGSATPYNYSFESGAYTTSAYYTGLPSGVYTIDFVDNNSCSSSIDVELQDAPLLVLTIDSLQDVKCKNVEDGYIYYSLNGGLAPYNYRLNSGSWQILNPSIGPLFAGVYNLEIIDSNGCIVSSSLTINEPTDELSVEILSIQDVNCLIDSIGTVLGMANGGVSPYQFSLDNINFQASGSFVNLPPGDYTFYCVDANNCETQADFSIVANSPVSLAWASIIPPSCETVNNGLLSVGTLMGTYPFSYTLNSGTAQAGGTFAGLGEGYYEIEVVDDLGCTATIDTLLSSEQTLMVYADSVQNIVCVADSSGAIYLNASGGVPGYSFFIDGQSVPSGVQENLSNGIYNTWVIDAVGCSDSTEIAVLQESLLQGSIFAQQNILCNNGSLGSVTVNGTTGISPYQYSIDGVNFDTLNTFENLEEGMYSIVIQDATLCEVVVEVDIQLLTEVEIEILTLMEPTCFGLNNATASFNVLNGIGPYTYTLDDGNPTNEFQFTDMEAGNHLIYAVDSQGCNDSLVFTLNQPEPISILLDSIGLASCFGMSDAYISVSAVNEVGNVLYSIDPPGTSNLNGLFEGLVDDSYEISIVDQNLCISDTIFTIESPSSLEVIVVEVNPLDCFGDSNGIVQLIVNGGVSPFSYEVDSIDFGNNQYINNLDYGLHQFVINDQNDCQTSGEFSLDQPDSLSIQFSLINDVSCNGMDNGTAFFIASGGVGDYSYELNGSIISDDGAFSNLLPQNYALSIYDSLLCSYDFDFSISEPDSLVIDSIISENPVCFADTNGSFSVYVSGGTPEYNYFVPGIGSTADSSFINMEGGAYYVSITDEKGCNTNDIVVLYEPDEFTLETLVVSPPLCFGDSTATAVLQAEGGSGTPSFGLSFDDLSFSSVMQNLWSGMHIVYAIDSLGCSDSTSVFIPEVDSLVFGGMIQNVTCFGGNDGEITFNPSGNSEEFLFSQDEVNWIDTNTFSGMYSGQQSFFMLDEFGCFKDTVFTISQPDSLYISSLTLFPVTCSDEYGGSIAVEIEGGVQPYESTLGNVTLNGPSLLFESLSIGEYQITTIDSNNCVFVLDTTLTDVDSVYANIDAVELNCYGDIDGSATVNYSGGSGEYYFLWNNSSSDSTSTTQANLVADVTYSVVVTDVLDSNCFAIAQVTPSQPPLIEFELFQYSPSCDPEDIWVNVELLNGGVEPFQYVVNDEDPVDSGVFTDLGLTSTRFEVIDSSECSVEQWIIPTNPNVIDAYFEVSENEVSMAEGEVVFTDLSDNTAYLKWDFGNEIEVEGDIGVPANAELTSGLMEQPIHNYTMQGEYLAKLSVSSDFGCEDEYERMITVKEDHRVFIPNSFTPDGDGTNDIFLVQGSTIDDTGFKLTIFDRSGTMVFQSFDINVGWNGLSQDGDDLRPEVYVFIVSYYSGGRLFEKNGTVTLLR